MAASDDDGDDFAFFMLAVAGAYFFWQLYRDRTAAAAGGGYFDAAPPPQDETSGILDILVPLNLSPTGAAFIKAAEGFRATAYADGSGGRTSIGYGHQIQPGENISQPISKGTADRLFAADAGAAAQTVSSAVLVQLTQSQFDALVDFVYNVGAAAFLNSTLLQLLNNGDYGGAAQQFSSWVHSNGQVNSGLIARRSAEQNLFNGG